MGCRGSSETFLRPSYPAILAVALQFRLPFLVGGLNGVFDCRHRISIGLRDDERYAELWGAAVDGLGLSDVGVAPPGLDSGDNLGGICELCHNGFLLSIVLEIFCRRVHHRPLVAHGNEGGFPLRLHDETAQQLLKLGFA